MFNVGLFILLMMIIGIHALYCDPSEGLKLFNGSCFRNTATGRAGNWEKIRDQCPKYRDGRFLAEPRSREEVDFIRNFNVFLPKDYWIGGKLDGGNWKWVKTGDLINWGAFSPYKPFGNGDCLMIKNNIYNENDPNNIIKKERCTASRKGMCQKPASPTPYPGQAVSNPDGDDVEEETRTDEETKKTSERKLYRAHQNKCKFWYEMICPAGTKWSQSKKVCVNLTGGEKCPVEG